MTDTPASQPPGWYYAQGDPPGTQRYWDGTQWQGGPQAVGTQPGAMGMGGPENNLASPWARLGARILDGLILLIPTLLVVFLIGGSGLGGFGADAGTSFALNFIGTIISTAIAVGYEFYFLSKDGATIGKKALNIKVVFEDGSAIGQDGAIKRLILTALQVIPIIGAIISFVVGLATIIMIFADKRRQVPADKVAKTLVINS